MKDMVSIFSRVRAALRGNQVQKPETPEESIENAEAAIEVEAQKVADQIDRAFTSLHALEAMEQRERASMNLWVQKSIKAAEEAKKHPEGSPERKVWENLVRKAVVAQFAAQKRAAVIDTQLAPAREVIAEAEKDMEAMGLNILQARSMNERLDISLVSAETKKRLAQFNLGQSELAKTVDYADKLVTDRVAEANAWEEIASSENPPADTESLDVVNDAVQRLIKVQ